MATSKDEFKVTMLICALVLAVSAIMSYTFAYYEAQAYNRVTGENVSAWDALFLELRVEGDPK